MIVAACLDSTATKHAGHRVGPNERENIKTLYDAYVHSCAEHGHRSENHPSEGA